MNPAIHKLSGRFCPFCLQPLWQVRETGFEFCPGNPACDYEVRGEQGRQPLTLADKAERVLKIKQREHRLLLQKIADLQQSGAELVSELTEMGYPPPAGGLDSTGGA